ncbi:Ppx/GppA family phosphatase [Ectothiorhodospiraceae bacterium 2226]|nr:Ppx/GppA family phosphatase [Ectothiorhodospiraceae bacterium 2226]
MAATEPARAAGEAQVAAVDLGSNSFHLIVARVVDGRVHVVDRLREMVRLGGGVDADGRLDPAVAERALACLRRFGQRLRGLPASNVRAVGTNALRQAHAAGAFRREAEAALGHAIEIVAGREEARLIFLGVARAEAPATGRRLVVDIGGGSTELVIGEGTHPLLAESLEIGCVSASRLVADPITAEGLRRAELAARLELEPYEAAFRASGWRQALGTSGTIKAVGAVAQASGWVDGAGITRPALDRLQEALLSAGSAQALKLPGLDADRRPVFAGGVAVLRAVFEALGLERLAVAESALREGLLYDLLGRLAHEDVRGATIEALSQRFVVDAAQAERVARTAGALLREAAGAWALTDDAHGELLAWGARLHELGLALAHNRYHRHGAYVLEHADLPGFSRDEQQRLALLVLAHRRKFPLEAVQRLPEAARQSLTRLAVLLRLAVVLHRGRNPEPIPTPSLGVDGDRLLLDFPPGWLDQHPLTRADLAQEAQYLRPLHLTLRCR